MSRFEDITEMLERGESAALLTVVETSGSAPRDVGTRMVVTRDDTYGTIGGGTVEGLAIDKAREVLTGDSAPGIRSYDLERGGNTGMVCGGAMDVFIDRVQGQPRLHIAGGGHIGQEVAALGVELGYRVTVVDDREAYADPDLFPDAVDVHHGDYRDRLSEAPMTSETAVVVATRSSTFDADATAAGLDGDAGYVGVVASEQKSKHITDSLVEEGYSRVELASVRSPVGLDLGGGSPADIALAILAEISLDRHAASGDRATRLDLDDLVILRGGGDLGSGVVYRLHQAGYPVVVTEVSEPTVVRRAVAFGTAMYEGTVTVEGVVGRRAESLAEAIEHLAAGEVSVIEDPEGTAIDRLDPAVVVDAIMAKGKTDTGTRRDDANVVVGLGPGFEAGEDVDAVVETDRGHRLGRVYYEGTASEYDGEPGERRGYTHERVFYAPTDGRWETAVDIGDTVTAGETVGRIDGTRVETEIGGLVRGLVASGITVSAGTKLGDTDPRGEDVDPAEISDKALCLGGGVLEAVLSLR